MFAKFMFGREIKEINASNYFLTNFLFDFYTPKMVETSKLLIVY